jgi:hypothetical protein
MTSYSDAILTSLSMFASNFIVKNTHLKHTRGEDKLTRFSQKNTIATGNSMENSFCSVCGTLMYRRSSGYPGASIPRIGTIDDFKLQETVFKPRIETFEKDRCQWLKPADVEEHVKGAYVRRFPSDCVRLVLTWMPVIVYSRRILEEQARRCRGGEVKHL